MPFCKKKIFSKSACKQKSLAGKDEPFVGAVLPSVVNGLHGGNSKSNEQ